MSVNGMDATTFDKFSVFDGIKYIAAFSIFGILFMHIYAYIYII